MLQRKAQWVVLAHVTVCARAGVKAVNTPVQVLARTAVVVDVSGQASKNHFEGVPSMTHPHQKSN